MIKRFVIAMALLLASMTSLHATANDVPTCVDHALFVKKIAIIRDHGNKQDTVIANLKDYFKQFPVEEDEQNNMIGVVMVVFNNPDSTPDELQKAYYNYCIKEFQT